MIAHKYAAVILASLLALTACGSEEKSEEKVTPTPEASTSASASPDDSASSDETPSADGTPSADHDVPTFDRDSMSPRDYLITTSKKQSVQGYEGVTTYLHGRGLVTIEDGEASFALLPVSAGMNFDELLTDLLDSAEPTTLCTGSVYHTVKAYDPAGETAYSGSFDECTPESESTLATAYVVSLANLAVLEDWQGIMLSVTSYDQGEFTHYTVTGKTLTVDTPGGRVPDVHQLSEAQIDDLTEMTDSLPEFDPSAELTLPTCEPIRSYSVMAGADGELASYSTAVECPGMSVDGIATEHAVAQYLAKIANS